MYINYIYIMLWVWLIDFVVDVVGVYCRGLWVLFIIGALKTILFIHLIN